MKLLVT
jgi:hypothetical protein